jgi:hypothetical protein
MYNAVKVVKKVTGTKMKKKWKKKTNHPDTGILMNWRSCAGVAGTP